jgi:antitoxin StbD
MNTTLERVPTMEDKPLMTNIFENMVPISDFNKGKGAKVIDDVKKTGYKIILKNNHPEAVIITPKEYSELIELKEEYDDMILGMEALRRLANFEPDSVVSHEEMLKKYGITEDDLNDIDVDIE